VNDGSIGRAVRRMVTNPTGDGDDGPHLPGSLVELLRAWMLDHPDDARRLIEPEKVKPKPKTPEQLDHMVSHVGYEVRQLIDFIAISNGWLAGIQGLPAGWAKFAAVGMLEAALTHTRCLAEFLRETGQPANTITAKDYVTWHWREGEQLTPQLAEIHGRVAHLGLIRCSVQEHDGKPFRWDDFLNDTAVPTLLGGFREFLAKLPAERLAQFNRVVDDDGTVVILDLDAMIAEALDRRL
jgi:hypothetical protein